MAFVSQWDGGKKKTFLTSFCLDLYKVTLSLGC